MSSFLSRRGLGNISAVSLRFQLARIRPLVLIGLIVAFGGVSSVYAFSSLTGVPLDWLTRDPADINGTGFYVGALSNVGLMLWSATVAICVLGAYLLSPNKRYRDSALFLLVSGMLCLMLVLDDAFMLHERVYPWHLHIPEVAVYSAYGIIFAGYFAYFSRRILTTDYLLLLLAFAFLGLSCILDQILPFSDLEAFMEDSLKFPGIVLWLAYFSHTTFTTVRESLMEH